MAGTKSATINMRVLPDVKSTAEEVFGNLGLSLTDAINAFLVCSIAVGGFPFEMKQPRYNRDTEEAIEEARAIADGKIQSRRYTSVEELFDDLNKD